MRTPSMNPIYTEDYGHYRIYVTHPTGRREEVTIFRDAPTVINSYSTADPFGPATASLSFPAITSFDSPGEGDLWWLVPWTMFEIRWEQEGALLDWRWEGFFVSEDISSPYTITCKGRMYQADNYLMKPFFPQQPIPYEQLIEYALSPLRNPGLLLSPLRIEWPQGWNTRVPDPDSPDYLWFLRPQGVSVGQRWTGLVSRNTGSWNKALSEYIQSLLANMYTPEGDQWTLTLEGSQPVLSVREPLTGPDDQTLVVFNGMPSLEHTISRDFSTSVNVIYGTGRALNGSEFSGQKVSTDGTRTWYEPFGWSPLVYPNDGSNPGFNPSIMRQEAHMSFQQGMDEKVVREVAEAKRRKFADPGYAGNITLNIDPMVSGKPFNRRLITAGRRILLKNYRGTDVLFHISDVTVNADDGQVSMTVDSKYRDALTVHEVLARTRDALDPVNSLQVGKQSVTVQDLLKPWSYTEGSGVLPSGGDKDATDLFRTMPSDMVYPWTSWTSKYPPSSYPQYYVKVMPTNGTKAEERWQEDGYSVPIKMAQNGQVRLSQIAAYKADGSIAPVSFHISLYLNGGVSQADMPMIPDGDSYDGYGAADRYPFFPEAFERIKPTGEEQDNSNVLLPQGADMVIGWGTYHVPAGYWPGSGDAPGAPSTGLLVDETSWSFDTTSDPSWDRYSAENNASNDSAGMLYAMIYVRDKVDYPVYFLGRFYRTEVSS